MDAAVPQQPFPAAVNYPATFELDRAEKIANWRPLVAWLLIIPHAIILGVLGTVAEIVAFIAWFVILFTGKLPDGMAGLISLYIRYSNRVSIYSLFMREEYPPFAFETTAQDPGDYPAVRTQFAPELENRNRLTVAFRLILAIPHAIVLGVLWLVGFFAWIGGFFVVLFTGKWSAGLQEFLLGILRWSTRFYAYVLLLADEYPPFSME
ncbi:MAG TPA: DUF4389 domain-containing protein [Acidimicrobiales bacterium]|jgi:hypothetical protein